MDGPYTAGTLWILFYMLDMLCRDPTVYRVASFSLRLLEEKMAGESPAQDRHLLVVGLVYLYPNLGDILRSNRTLFFPSRITCQFPFSR